MGRQKVFVAGMHRSGTSALAGSLHSAGWSAGPEENLLPPGPDNIKGYFENVELMHINDCILADNGMSWDFVIPPSRQSKELKISSEIKDRITNLLSDERVLLLKDPRLCITLPVWLRYVENYSVVIPIRDSLETTRSLQKRNHFSSLHCHFLIRSYLRHLAIAARGSRVFGVSYDDLVNDPGVTLESLLDWLGRLGESDMNDLLPSDLEFDHQFVDSTLRNHLLKDADTESMPKSTDSLLAQFKVVTESFQTSDLFEEEWECDYFDVVSEARDREKPFTVISQDYETRISALQETISEVQESLVAEQSQVSRVRILNDELTERVRVLNRQADFRNRRIDALENHIFGIKETLSWRITAPLRIISKVLRRKSRNTSSRFPEQP